MFVEVQLHLGTLKRQCVELQLCEVTKTKTLKQTHLWILIRALTSEKTVVPAHLRLGRHKGNTSWAQGPCKLSRTTTVLKKLQEFYYKQLKTYCTELDNVFLSWNDRRADSLCSVQLQTNTTPQILPCSHFNDFKGAILPKVLREYFYFNKMATLPELIPTDVLAITKSLN